VRDNWKYDFNFIYIYFASNLMLGMGKPLVRPRPSSKIKHLNSKASKSQQKLPVKSTLRIPSAR